MKKLFPLLIALLLIVLLYQSWQTHQALQGAHQLTRSLHHQMDTLRALSQQYVRLHTTYSDLLTTLVATRDHMELVQQTLDTSHQDYQDRLIYIMYQLDTLQQAYDTLSMYVSPLPSEDIRF